MSSELVLIELSRGMVAWTTREAYDRCDLGRCSWCLTGYKNRKGELRPPSQQYAQGSYGPGRYRSRGLKRKTLHAVILGVYQPDRPSPQHLPDHRNRITMDCRPENLRWLTPGENRRNSERQRNKRVCRGVMSMLPHGKKLWHTSTAVGGKTRSKYFPHTVDGLIAAVHWHNEQVRTHFPETGIYADLDEALRNAYPELAAAGVA